MSNKFEESDQIPSRAASPDPIEKEVDALEKAGEGDGLRIIPPEIVVARER